MVRQTLYLLDWDWLVYVYYEVRKADAPEILWRLMDIGCSGDDLARAKDNLSRAERNTALTYSDTSSRTSVIAFARATSAQEFFNSFEHEKTHLMMHIAAHDGIDISSEEFAYLSGAISQQMFLVARRFLCDCCRKRVCRR